LILSQPFATSNPAPVTTTNASGTGAGGPAVSVLTATPTTAARVVPQPLVAPPTLNREGELSLPGEEESVDPLDWTIPALGLEYVARQPAATDLDLLEIARQAEALGRVAYLGDGAEGPALAPRAVPILTDLTVRDPAPTVDPLLTGVVVAVAGSLALRPDRSDSRRQRLPLFRPGR
jgi:hypothetical protein